MRRRVVALAKRIHAPPALLPSFGRSTDGGRPHITCDGSRYYYAVVERGRELERRPSCDLDELLYWVFRAVTGEMASVYESSRREPGRDFRRIMWEHQLKLLGILHSTWQARRKEEIRQILRLHPYQDRAQSSGPADVADAPIDRV